MDMVYSNLSQAGLIWVPCIPNYAQGSFIPIYNLTNMPQQTPSSVTALPRGGLKTKPWTHEEDEVLKNQVIELGVKKWARIAKALNDLFDNKRKGKNCRERWNNHLNPNINKGEWTYQEDLLLLKEYKKSGRRWSSISKLLQGRTENSVKNRWSTLMKSVQSAAGSNHEAATDYLIAHIDEVIRNKEN